MNNSNTILDIKNEFLIIAVFGLVITIFGMRYVLRKGAFYLWGEPIYRMDSPVQFWLLFANLVFAFLVSVFLCIISIPWPFL